MFNKLKSFDDLLDALQDGAGRHDAGKMVGQFAVFEEVDGRKAADAHTLGHVFGGFDVNAVKAHAVCVICCKAFDDGVHDGALTQPLSREDDQKWFAVPFPQQVVEVLFAYCWVCI